MTPPLKILLLEDTPADAEIITRLLKKSDPNCQLQTVATRKAFLEALNSYSPEVILSDNSLPQFDALAALHITRKHNIHIPFIIVTGTMSEDFAVNVIKSGADDYILKDRLTRLPAAVEAAVRQRKIEQEKDLAEKNLRQREEQYRTLVERISDGFMSLDPDWQITYINPVAEQLFKRPAGYLVGKSMLEEFPAGEGGSFFNAYQEAFRAKRNLHIEDYSILLKRWLQASFYPSDTGVSIFFRDITEQRQAEAEARKSEEKYRIFVERITDAFIALDKNWNYTYVNKHAGKMIHRDPADLIGKNVWKEFPEAVGSDTYKAFHQAMDTQQYVTNTDYFAPLNLWQENHIYPSEDGLTVFVRDVSEKKKAEQEIKESYERFEMVTSATNDVIRDWDLSSNSVWWNNNYYTHFGYQRRKLQEDISSWQERIFPGDRERVSASLDSAIADKQHLWMEEYRFLKSDNSIAFVLDCEYIVYQKNGSPYRIVGAMMDITDRKNAEDQLKKSFVEKQELAERLFIILNTLPANIALLDQRGVIVDMNDSWRHSTDENGFIGSNCGIGDDYISMSRSSPGTEPADSRAAGDGIEAVLDNRLPEFVFEYPCHSQGLERWFRMVVTPLHKEYGGAVVMHIDISELRRLERERMASKMEEQRKITDAILSAQEKERNAIGIELHDNVNQILVGTNLVLTMIRSFPERASELITSCINNIKLAIEENRKIAHELVSPDSANKTLLQQIDRLSHSMLQPAGLKSIVYQEQFNEELLTDNQRLAIYRILQEQCTNIIKYAMARNVVFVLSTAANQFSLQIADDGVGMDPEKVSQGIGLKNMASRLSVFSGTLNIVTSPGNGFELRVEFPL